MAYETVLWDLDGTIIDSFGIYSDVLAQILPGHDLPVPSAEVLRRNYHGTLSESIDSAVGGLSPARLEVITGDFLTAQIGYYDVVEHHLLEDAILLARRLHEQGAYQVVVTNREHQGRLSASPRNIVEGSSLNGLINDVICGDDVEFRKPDSRVVSRLMAVGMIQPELTLVIGDQYVDAELAKNLGARAVLVSREHPPEHLERLGPGYESFLTVVSSLDEVA